MFLERLSPTDALYFTIVTITTVGYGDFYPTTLLGKVLAVAVIIIGIGTFLGLVANSTEMLLSGRERRITLQKMRTIIGIFFSEVGMKLLATVTDSDPRIDQIRKELVVTNGWSEKEFLKVSKYLKGYTYEVEIRRIDLEGLRNFLLGKRDFMLRLLENQSLAENEPFTELLRAMNCPTGPI